MPFFKPDNGLMFLIEATFVIAPQRSNKELHQKNLLREGEETAKSAGYRQYESPGNKEVIIRSKSTFILCRLLLKEIMLSLLLMMGIFLKG